MKKFALTILTGMAILTIIAPMISVQGNSGFSDSLYHSLAWGHNGTAHFTRAQLRGGESTAFVDVPGVGADFFRAANGRQAEARVTARSSAGHRHASNIGHIPAN